MYEIDSSHVVIPIGNGDASFRLLDGLCGFTIECRPERDVRKEIHSLAGFNLVRDLHLYHLPGADQIVTAKMEFPIGPTALTPNGLPVSGNTYALSIERAAPAIGRLQAAFRKLRFHLSGAPYTAFAVYFVETPAGKVGWGYSPGTGHLPFVEPLEPLTDSSAEALRAEVETSQHWPEYIESAINAYELSMCTANTALALLCSVMALEILFVEKQKEGKRRLIAGRVKWAYERDGQLADDARETINDLYDLRNLIVHEGRLHVAQPQLLRARRATRLCLRAVTELNLEKPFLLKQIDLT